MVKILNRLSIILLALLLLLTIVITIIKVVKNHNTKLLEVTDKYIVEQAKNCVNEKKCLEEKITLQTLYDLNYMDFQADPVTKEYYNPESYITVDGTNYSFVTVR